MKSSIAITALVATIVAVGAALPASADDATQAAYGGPGGNQFHLQLNGDRNGPGAGPGKGMGEGRIGAVAAMMLACSPSGTEALDVALLRLSYRLNLTDTQKPLWDSFREKALTTETSFADQCKSDLPASTADTKPDLIAVLKGHLAVEQARLTALNGVLPDFETLYDSLTDQQKAALLPRGGGMKGMQRPAGVGRTPRPDGVGRVDPNNT